MNHNLPLSLKAVNNLNKFDKKTPRYLLSIESIQDLQQIPKLF